MIDVDSKNEYIKRLNELKEKAKNIKIEIDYYNSLQLALKTVLNGIYGAFAAKYYIMYNSDVANTITAQGRDLTKTMDRINEYYWYNIWHKNVDLHKKLCIKNVKKIDDSRPVSIYADTDSLFISFKPAMDSCDWKNLYINEEYINSIKENTVIISPNCYFNNSYIKIFNNPDDALLFLKDNNDYKNLIIDGEFLKNKNIDEFIKNNQNKYNILWNWSNEVDFILGIDHYDFSKYIVNCLNDYAKKYGVVNREDFELERISESIINLTKRKYINHIRYEDGVKYDKLEYILTKGFVLISSSTPEFARVNIMNVIKYIFENPNNYNINDLIDILRNIRRQFELSPIEDICLQSSCSNYEKMVIDDSNLPLKFKKQTHFAIKAAAHYNYLLKKNKEYQIKYDFIKSKNKIKYYYCSNSNINKVFGFIRGSFPIEFAPPVDYDTQFEKCILSPINMVIEKLGLPKINKGLIIKLDLFK